MQRCFGFCLFAALLFGAGIFAGQRIHLSQQTLTDVKAIAAPQTYPEPLQPTARMQPTPEILKASHHKIAEDGSSPSPAIGLLTELESFMSDLGPSEPLDNSPAALTADSSNRARVLEVINRYFPDADSETANVWADSYRGMGLEEVDFILEQKRTVSASLDSHLAGSVLAPPSALPESIDSELEAESPNATSIQLVKRNLQSAWCPGFRRTVVLPERMPHVDGETPNAGSQFHFNSFVSFEPGKMITSPVPSHVAIPGVYMSLMFALDGDKFTRRGDFQILNDRRVGLVSTGANYALRGSPIIPEDADEIRIMEDGQIQYEDSSGEYVSAGQIEIALIEEPHRLTSDDGVIFVSNSAKPLQFVPTVVLSTNSLELSSVNHDEENQLLKQLQSASVTVGTFQ